MNLVRYNKPNTLLNWNFDSLFDDFFDVPRGHSYNPPVDIEETGEAYKVTVELPGMSEKDFQITVKDDVLTLSSAKEEEKEEKKKNYLLKERRSYSFKRSFVLPKNADREKIDGAFKNGVLTLTLNKIPEAQPRTIEVKPE